MDAYYTVLQTATRVRVRGRGRLSVAEIDILLCVPSVSSVHTRQFIMCRAGYSWHVRLAGLSAAQSFVKHICQQPGRLHAASEESAPSQTHSSLPESGRYWVQSLVPGTASPNTIHMVPCSRVLDDSTMYKSKQSAATRGFGILV